MYFLFIGNVVNGTIGKQMVDTLVESASNVEVNIDNSLLNFLFCLKIRQTVLLLSYVFALIYFIPCFIFLSLVLSATCSYLTICVLGFYFWQHCKIINLVIRIPDNGVFIAVNSEVLRHVPKIERSHQLSKFSGKFVPLNR